jgi:hypothetical protein
MLERARPALVKRRGRADFVAFGLELFGRFAFGFG